MSAENNNKRSLESSEDQKAEKKGKFAIIPYLFFPGNANDAIDFYAKVFNAEVPLRMKYEESGAGACPGATSDMTGKIIHAKLTFYGMAIMISDDCPGYEETTHGNSVQLSIDMDDLEDMTRIFNALAEGGKIAMPLEKQFWNAHYGKVIDRFGIVWGLNSYIKESEDKAAEENPETPTPTPTIVVVAAEEKTEA